MTPISAAQAVLDEFSSVVGGKIGVVTKPGTDVSPLNIVQTGSHDAGTKNLSAPKGLNVPGAASAATTTQKNNVSVWDTFWAKVYSIPGASDAADSIISAGATVEKAKAQAVEGIKLGFTWGPTVLVVLVGLYLIYPFLLSSRR